MAERTQEEEYFHQRDQEKIEKLKAQQAAEASLEESQRLQALHYFHCGKCGNKMDTHVYKGVEIEMCTNCGAVLLDPGELETLVGKDERWGEQIKEFFGFTRQS